jgi:hypothetical protein
MSRHGAEGHRGTPAGEKFDHWGGDTCYSRFSGGLQSRESREGATVSLIFSRSTVRRAQQISMTTLGAQGKVSAEPFAKKASPAVACPPDAKPVAPGAAGNTADQNRLKPCRERSSGL